MKILDIRSHPEYKHEEDKVMIEWNDSNYLPVLIAMTKDLPEKGKTQ